MAVILKRTVCDAGRRRRTRCTRMRGDGLEQRIHSEMDKQDDGGTHERKTRGGGDTVKRTQQREKHSAQGEREGYSKRWCTRRR